jgi:hypothetical protein
MGRESEGGKCSERGVQTLIIGEQMLRSAFARSVVRWLMKPSSRESVVPRNTPSVDVEEISTVCIVANSLSSQEYKHALNLLFAMLIDKIESGAHRCEGEKKDVQERNEEQKPETKVKCEAIQQEFETLLIRIKPSCRHKIRIVPGEKNDRNSR